MTSDPSTDSPPDTVLPMIVDHIGRVVADETIKLSPEDLKKLREYVVEMTCLHRRIPEDEYRRSLSQSKLINEIKEAVAGYPEDFLLDIGYLLGTEHEAGKQHSAFHVGGPLNHHLVRDYLHFSPQVRAYGMDTMQKLIVGLHDYPQLPNHKQLSAADKDTVDLCLSLLRVTLAIDEFEVVPVVVLEPGNHNTMSMRITDELAQVVVDHPDHADFLVSTISERRNTDPKFLRSLIESPVPALAEGIL